MHLLDAGGECADAHCAGGVQHAAVPAREVRESEPGRGEVEEDAGGGFGAEEAGGADVAEGERDQGVQAVGAEFAGQRVVTRGVEFVAVDVAPARLLSLVVGGLFSFGGGS